MANEQDLELQGRVLAKAVKLYQERDDTHDGLWKNDAPFELAGLMLHKAKRVEHLCRPGAEKPEQAIDEALDLINYAAFTIRRLSGDLDTF
jgi:hypothetical protein